MNRRTQIIVALIGAGGVIAAAIITGIFSLRSPAPSPTPNPSVTSTSQPFPTSAPSSTVMVAGGITGTWRGEWVIDSFSGSYADTLFLTQTGDSITGTGKAYYISSPNVTLSETITGSILGNSVKLTEHINELHNFRVFTLTLSQDGQSLNGSCVGCYAYGGTTAVQFTKQ